MKKGTRIQIKTHYGYVPAIITQDGRKKSRNTVVEFKRKSYGREVSIEMLIPKSGIVDGIYVATDEEILLYF